MNQLKESACYKKLNELEFLIPDLIGVVCQYIVEYYEKFIDCWQIPDSLRCTSTEFALIDNKLIKIKNNVEVFDLKGKLLNKWTAKERISYSCCCCCRSINGLIIGSYEDNYVYRYDWNGNLINRWTHEKIKQLYGITGNDSEIYCTDSATERINVFDFEGKFLREISRCKRYCRRIRSYDNLILAMDDSFQLNILNQTGELKGKIDDVYQGSDIAISNKKIFTFNKYRSVLNVSDLSDAERPGKFIRKFNFMSNLCLGRGDCICTVMASDDYIVVITDNGTVCVFKILLDIIPDNDTMSL
jgi:hypothetical protein